MDAEQIKKSDFLDIVFDGRNKAYGAYELRRAYGKRLTMALIGVAIGTAVIAGAVFLSQKLKPEVKEEKFVQTEISLEEVKQPEEEKPVEPPPPPPPKQEPPPQVEMKQFTPPVIKKDEEVRTPPPAVEELKEVKIGDRNQEGVKDQGIVVPPAGVDGGKGIVAAPPAPPEKEPEIFTKVEKEAEYPGGTSSWRRFLERNLDGQVAVDNGAPPGNYTVQVKFVVDVEGKVSQVNALNKVGYGMEAEAEKAIKKSGKWIPAVQNGKNVKAYRTQPITFQVSAE